LATVIRPGNRDSEGGRFDLLDLHCPYSQQVKHDSDAARDAAIAVLPTTNAPRANAEQPCDAGLRDIKHGERLTEFSRGRGVRVSFPARWTGRPFCWF